ncbi:tyrosine-type recombinase/integrase [Metabacillus fastidiosus]|uniref:tyrosine-type recombinase/integrase n=1 Tax=Metabacillus fastidiosus TaxID=1458 RepID=UPI002E1D4102|nr:site-specific integrase [Metabacillus fastidiosus]MED4454894.1 tyrosine-type recombinase/integrase [Metabacillus fastidiosus]
MKNVKITLKSTPMEAFNDYKNKKRWSPKTIETYTPIVMNVQKDMIERGLEAILENITYDYVLTWKNELQKKNLSPGTVKLNLSTMASLFGYLNKLGIASSNPFLLIDVENYNGLNHHSRVLSFSELFEVYKAAHELDSTGVAVLTPILIDLFTGLRSTSLKKLQVRSISKENNGLIYKFDPKDHDKNEENYQDNDTSSNSNRKNKDFFLPLPPKLMDLLINTTQNMDPQESLLYGLKGKAFANKQMNYIIDKVCEHLGWIKVEYENTPINDNRFNRKKVQKKGKKVITKTEKAFTPHGFRYTLATLFHEIGVSEDGIRFLLGHSKYELGNLRHYILSDTKYINEIKSAQTLMEAVFETAMQLETNYNIKMDLELIFSQLSKAFEYQKRHPNYVNNFKAEIISFSLFKLKEEMQKNRENQLVDTFTFKAPELNDHVQTTLQQGYVPMHNQTPSASLIQQFFPTLFT